MYQLRSFLQNCKGYIGAVLPALPNLKTFYLTLMSFLMALLHPAPCLQKLWVFVMPHFHLGGEETKLLHRIHTWKPLNILITFINLC